MKVGPCSFRPPEKWPVVNKPYLVEQERMANAQLLMYGSKHLKQNFFFLKKCEYPICMVLNELEIPPDLKIVRLLGGSPRADRARCQLANPTTQRRQGVAEAARWGFHCGREGHRGLPGPFLRAAPEPFLTDFGVRGHLARLGARLAQPPDRPRAAPAPRRRAPGVCPGAADTLSRGAGGPGLAGGPVMSPDTP